MSMVLAILGWGLFTLAIFSGLALNLVGLFGNWVILLAIACAGLLSGFEHFGWWTLAALFGLAIVGEIVEFAASGVGTARYGGSKGSAKMALGGCLVGGMLGTVALPIIGTVAGACAGAFILVVLHEVLVAERAAKPAIRAGTGAVLGKLGGLVLKSLVGLIMLGVAAYTF